MRRRTVSLAIAASVVSACLVAPQLASSTPAESDTRAQREKVRAEKAVVAAELDTSRASKAEIDAALAALAADLDTQQAALDKANADLETAKQELEAARSAITSLTETIAVLEDEMERRAIAAFVNPASEELLSALESRDFTTAVEQTFWADLRSQDDADIEARLTGAKVDLEAERERAVEAEARAEEIRAEQEERTEAVAAAKQRQETLADSLQATIDAQIARSIELAKTDRELSAKIAKEQAELQARLAAARAAEEKRTKEEAERRRKEEEAASRFVSAAGKESAPTPPSGGGGTPSGPIGSTPGGVDAGVQLAYVQGIPVNAAVADQVVAMINAAAADGVSLRIGNSYRSVSRQIELRRQNCGSSYYAIYQMSSGSCRPPTARPGQSQHQLGLAIDFANCSYRSTACFQWLAGNASRFGYYNLPSEPWHWSTTGS